MTSKCYELGSQSSSRIPTETKIMSDFKISRRELMGIAAGIMTGGIPGVAMDASAAPAKSTKSLGTATASVKDLRCEYLINPLGIDEPTPRLSWTIQSDVRGWRQSAYEIAVARTYE